MNARNDECPWVCNAHLDAREAMGVRPTALGRQRRRADPTIEPLQRAGVTQAGLIPQAQDLASRPVTTCAPNEALLRSCSAGDQLQTIKTRFTARPSAVASRDGHEAVYRCSICSAHDSSEQTANNARCQCKTSQIDEE